MSWKNGQCPQYVWLKRDEVGAKRKEGRNFGAGARLAVGSVLCWTMEPHKPKQFACYRLVPVKSKR